jgi:hypothetical protein
MFRCNKESRRAVAAVVFLFFSLTQGCQTYTESLEKSVDKADETGAIAMLHAIAVAQQTYNISNEGEYGTLKQLTDGGFLDPRYASDKPVKDYVITLNVTPKQSGMPEGSYTCNADPEKPSERFGRHLYIDSTSGVIHVNLKQPATATDPAIQ